MLRPCCLLIILLALVLAPTPAHGQSVTNDHKLKAGAFFFTGVNLEGFGETLKGVGGRITYNFTETPRARRRGELLSPHGVRQQAVRTEDVGVRGDRGRCTF